MVIKFIEMNITTIKVKIIEGDPKLKAFITIVLDDSFAIRELKVIQGDQRLFVAMPAKRMKDGTFKDLVHPLNKASREELEKAILEAYKDALEGK